ncbi:hypothetical protein ANAEL_04674 [Anaerolineales bacterium]|nr:hypothetical protein ANAEL_04674 [Anaerolineales bacterium]
MSDYERATRGCSVSQLQPELRQAIQNYFQEQNLGDPGTEAVLCCETISTRKSSGWLDSLLSGNVDATIHMGMLLTAGLLIWVRKGDRSDIVLTAADLKEIQVKIHASFFDKDNGLEITGFVRDAQSRIHGYVGMGAEPAAQKFCEEVEKAVAKVKPPAEKGFARWLRG